ncbi:MAG: hypothetical protein JO097_15440 [Acidobacteriaceae bacterium]|nr:hypothetical protein [Acidobacteriaceae bacterium]
MSFPIPSSEGKETRAMVPEAADRSEDLEQLRRRFEEFRNAQPGYKRLPKPLWAAAVELAQRYKVNPTARALRLEYSGLRRRVENQRRPRRKRTAATPPSFLEFVAPGAKAAVVHGFRRRAMARLW